MAGRRMSGRWQATATDSRVEPVAVHPQFPCQSPDRPLAIEVRRRPELLGQRELVMGPPDRAHHAGRHAGTPRRVETFGRQALGDYPVGVPSAPSARTRATKAG